MDCRTRLEIVCLPLPIRNAPQSPAPAFCAKAMGFAFPHRRAAVDAVRDENARTNAVRRDLPRDRHQGASAHPQKQTQGQVRTEPRSMKNLIACNAPPPCFFADRVFPGPVARRRYAGTRVAPARAAVRDLHMGSFSNGLQKQLSMPFL